MNIYFVSKDLVEPYTISTLNNCSLGLLHHTKYYQKSFTIHVTREEFGIVMLNVSSVYSFCALSNIPWEILYIPIKNFKDIHLFMFIKRKLQVEE